MENINPKGLEKALAKTEADVDAPVGVDVIRELNGVLPKGAASTRGIVVCPSGFTADAINFARDRNITLWDRHHHNDLNDAQPQGV